MLFILGISGSIAFFLIAGLQLYWVFTGADLSRYISLDKNGNRMNPGKAATAITDLIFVGAALLPLVSLNIIVVPIPQSALDIMLILGIVVLLFRGIAGLIASLVKKKPRDIFDTWNIRLYTWICVFLALTYFACFFYSN
jgi:hypothetical protein